VVCDTCGTRPAPPPPRRGRPATSCLSCVRAKGGAWRQYVTRWVRRFGEAEARRLCELHEVPFAVTPSVGGAAERAERKRARAQPPVEQAPVEQAPVEQAPVEQAPMARFRELVALTEERVRRAVASDTLTPGALSQLYCQLKKIELEYASEDAPSVVTIVVRPPLSAPAD